MELKRHARLPEGHGYTLCNLGDYDLDGFSDLAIGVPKYNASTGAIFVISGRFNTTKSSSLYLRDNLLYTIHGTYAGDLLGSSLSCSIDFDRNGYRDILAGAPGYGRSIGYQQDCGIAYLLFGLANFKDIYLQFLTSTQGTSYFYNVNSKVNTGASVLAVDLTGDDNLAIVISSPRAGNFAGTGSGGYVFVLYEGTLFSKVNLRTFELSATRQGILIAASGTTNLGISLDFLRDIDGDRRLEFVIGAPYVQKTYILLSEGMNSKIDLSNPFPSRVITLHGSDLTNDYFGVGVKAIDNFNGYGSSALMVSAPMCVKWAISYQGAGAVYLFNISNSTSHIFVNNATSTQMTKFIGSAPSLTGFGMNAIADVNGDGLREVVICGPQMSYQGLANRGVCYVIFGQATGISDLFLSNLLPSQGYAIYGAQALSFLGQSVEGVDFNHDGYGDLAIGLVDPYGSANTKVFIVFGNKYQTSPPSFRPTTFPTRKPSSSPSFSPTRFPSRLPSALPSVFPSSPTLIPTLVPTLFPSSRPTTSPTKNPTIQPTLLPSVMPSYWPTVYPTFNPSLTPTVFPSSLPSTHPTLIPIMIPTLIPTSNPSSSPTEAPTYAPSFIPTVIPSNFPTVLPTVFPTIMPSCFPTYNPTFTPSVIPTILPSGKPTFIPSILPTNGPTLDPSTFPSFWPSCLPTVTPTCIPTFIPTTLPSSSPTDVPTLLPTLIPTNFPTVSPTVFPTIIPSCFPTHRPTFTPSVIPTILPSGKPTFIPSILLTNGPTLDPSTFPSFWPSCLPTVIPTRIPTFMPTTLPSSFPTDAPTLLPMLIPTNFPTLSPTDIPTPWPASLPTDHPNFTLTLSPTIMPSGKPSLVPTLMPTHTPSELPTFPPTDWPTDFPSPGPNFSPSWLPSIDPTDGKPTWKPTWVPTTIQPTPIRTIDRSVTIELLDADLDIQGMAYNPKMDSIMLTTAQDVLTIAELTNGKISGNTVVPNAEVDRSNRLVVSGDAPYLYLIDQVQGGVGITRYNVTNARYHMRQFTTYFAVLTGALVADQYLVTVDTMPAGYVMFHIFACPSIQFLIGSRYDLPGTVPLGPMLAASDDVSVYQSLFHQAKGEMSLLQLFLARSVASLQAWLYSFQDVNAQLGDQHQFLALARMKDGHVLALAQRVRQSEKTVYRCFKAQQQDGKLMAVDWAWEMNIQATAVFSISSDAGDEAALVCACYGQFDGAPGNQLVMMLLNQTSGQLMAAVRIVSLLAVEGDCHLIQVGTRGTVFGVNTILSSGKRGALLGFVHWIQSALVLSSLPPDVSTVVLSDMRLFGFSSAQFTMASSPISVSASTTGYTSYSYEVNKTSILLTSNQSVYALAQPSLSPTKKPTFFPARLPTIQPFRLPSVRPSCWPSLRPSVVAQSGETNDPVRFSSFFPTVDPTILEWFKRPTFFPSSHNVTIIQPSFLPVHTIDENQQTKLSSIILYAVSGFFGFLLLSMMGMCFFRYRRLECLRDIVGKHKVQPKDHTVGEGAQGILTSNESGARFEEKRNGSGADEVEIRNVVVVSPARVLTINSLYGNGRREDEESWPVAMRKY